MSLKRAKMKAQLIYKTDGKCQLCGGQATDLHEILNKAHLPDEACPIEFRSLLCRDCHQHAESNRVELIRVNLEIYGWARMNEAWSNLSKTYSLPSGLLNAVDEALNSLPIVNQPQITNKE